MIRSVNSSLNPMAYSQTHGPANQDDLYQTIDSNGDGSLDETEIATFSEKNGGCGSIGRCRRDNGTV